MTEDRIARHVVITGRVQGVGYRYWTKTRAEAAGLAGFVRNRPDGSVEAVFCGAAGEVADMVARCRVGPRGAGVVDVSVQDWTTGEAFAGFSILPTG